MTQFIPDEKIRLHLQEKFGLSEIKANVIFFTLQEHFLNQLKVNKNQAKSLGVT